MARIRKGRATKSSTRELPKNALSTKFLEKVEEAEKYCETLKPYGYEGTMETLGMLHEIRNQVNAGQVVTEAHLAMLDAVVNYTKLMAETADPLSSGGI